ncbi:MAG: flagellar hook-associated protein FlgK [Gammaproteobacteria bacterium]|jgi:flagellar hook-associated protein 1 FlgK
MASSDILGIGTSALLAYQRALQTTSHNIANVNTDGYSRQRVDQTSNEPALAGNYYLGSGTQIAGVQRMVSQFANNQVNDATSANSRYQTYSQYAAQVDNLLADSSAGLQPALQGFFDAVHGVANDPNSIPARQDLLSQAQVLVGRFQTLYQQIDSGRVQVNSELTNEVDTINGLATQIAQLNSQIVSSPQNGPAGQPNDLLDKRDALLKQLAGHVSVKTVTQSDGSVNVMIGTGQALVVGGNTTRLAVQGVSGDPGQLDLVFQTSSGNVPVGNVIAGGKLGGLLDARNQVVIPAENALGRLAVGLAEQFNVQQHQGVDLTGAFGSDFFTVPTPKVFSAPTNAATSGQPSVSISDPAALTAKDYQLSYDGSNWTLRNATTNQTVTMTGAGTAANPFVADGLSIVVPSTVTAGDRFQIEPTRQAAQSIGLAIDDPRQVAAAAPVVSAAAGTNTGTATVSTAQVTNIADPNLRHDVTITLNNPPNTYTLTDNTSGATVTNAYNPAGTTVAYNGWQVTLGGAAQAGDSFSVGATGPGDNGNALALAGIQQQRYLQSGTATLGDTYSQLVAQVGSNTQAAQSNAATQQSLLDQATSIQQSISGVNLDEEAAQLVKYQQAYQASAKVISTANTLFQSLLSAVRGG